TIQPAPQCSGGERRIAMRVQGIPCSEGPVLDFLGMRKLPSRRALFSLPACLAGFVLLGLASLLAQAQTITTTVGTGATPSAVAINPVTNKISVANMHSNNVTVIDGASNTATTVNVGQAPTALAVNSVTNKIYVANGQGNSNTVTVI